MMLIECVKWWICSLSNDIVVEGFRGVDIVWVMYFISFGKNMFINGVVDYDEYEDVGGEVWVSDYVDYDYEFLGAVSGTYVVVVLFIFFE